MFADSSLIFFAVSTDTVHCVYPIFLHPWSIGGSLILIVNVLFLWNVTPSSPGLNMVVYPLSANMFMLISDLVRPGSMFAFLASDDSCSNGSALCWLPLVLSCLGGTL